MLSRGGWPNALDFSLDLELNIPRMHYLMNNSFMECFVHYVMNSNCACVRSTTLDNFALDQTSLDKVQSSRLHSTRWPNALDISLNMHVERCIVKSRERLARALGSKREKFKNINARKKLGILIEKCVHETRPLICLLRVLTTDSLLLTNAAKHSVLKLIYPLFSMYISRGPSRITNHSIHFLATQSFG